MARKHKWYRTAYPVHWKPPRVPEAASYGSNLWAPDLKTAHLYIKLRGCSEMIIGGPSAQPVNHPNLPVMILKEKPWLDILHAACFTCWHASRAGIITPDEVLGDGGLIHGISHALCIGASQPTRERLAELAMDIELRIPGWVEP